MDERKRLGTSKKKENESKLYSLLGKFSSSGLCGILHIILCI